MHVNAAAWTAVAADDGDVHAAYRNAVQQFVNARGVQVAQQRVRTTREHGGEFSRERHAQRTDAVYAAVQQGEATVADTVIDRVHGNAGLEQSSPSNHSVLRRGERGDAYVGADLHGRIGSVPHSHASICRHGASLPMALGDVSMSEAADQR